MDALAFLRRLGEILSENVSVRMFQSVRTLFKCPVLNAKLVRYSLSENIEKPVCLKHLPSIAGDSLEQNTPKAVPKAIPMATRREPPAHLAERIELRKKF